MKTVAIDIAIVERFRDVVRDRVGLWFDADKLQQLGEVLRDRCERTREASQEHYLRRLVHPRGWPQEWSVLAEQLTVSETYFFRYRDQFRAFLEAALPARSHAKRSARELRILSAGCASGEEAYTISILLRDLERGGLEPCRVQITGVDISPAMIEKARRGRYSRWSLRELPQALRERYFQAAGDELVLDPVVRGMVTFEELNLLNDAAAIWTPGAWDVVFCRNTLMYFTADAMRRVVERIAGSLQPGGFLFLGHAENLRGVSDEFHLRHTHQTFYYQRKDPAERSPAAAHDPAVSAERPPVSSCAPPGPATAWVDSIQRASERIASLISRPASREASPVPAARQPGAHPALAAPPRRWGLQSAVELLQKERFSAALDELRSLPPGAENDPDVLLLSAVILTNSGDHASAEAACRTLLAADELNSGAHYLLALCREHAGSSSSAVGHYQTAAYLDPGFGMPRLHLGLLFRREGNLEAARRELAQALALLEEEAATRIHLFGGGFTREALVDLCRNTLQLCGGAP